MRRAARALAALAALAAGITLVRRRRAASPERLELYFADGSSVTFHSDSPEGERVLPLARRALSAARS